MNNLQIFNFEGNEVEVFDYNGEILFNPKDVGKCLDLSDVTVRRHIQSMNKNQVIKLTNGNISDVGLTNFRKLNNAGENFLKEAGVYKIIQCCTTKTEQFKEGFINSLTVKGLLKDNYRILISRPETEFLDQLEESLKPFDLTGIRQYKVLNYRVDFYIPNLNIAVEYDENDHKGYSYEKQEGRQSEIEKELNCRFIRVSDNQSNDYNIGFVIKNIFNL